MSEWRGIWIRCTSHKCRSCTLPWKWDFKGPWYARTSRTSYYEYITKEKTYLGKRNHIRSRKVWSSRRLHNSKQEIKSILQWCSFDVWSCRSRTHQLWGSCTKERMGWSNDGRILVDHEEWCLGYCSQTRKQECGIFEMDLQDKACCRWKYWEVKINICG